MGSGRLQRPIQRPLHWALTTEKQILLIILPQALRISIPGIVDGFIGLFMDTPWC